MISDPRQIEVLAKMFGKANPPPIIFRYRRPNEWTINEIAKHQVHLPRPQDMNDPFEYQAPIEIDLQMLKAKAVSFYQMQGMPHDTAREESEKIDASTARLLMKGISDITKNSGVICCSATPLSNRMWAYYADAHRGICIGYRTDRSPFCMAMPVIYENPDEPMEVMKAMKCDVTLFCDHLARRKGKEWEFEQEYRIPVGEIPTEMGRILPVPPDSIKELRFGVNIDPKFRDEVYHAIQKLPNRPKLIQIGCDYKRFSLTETILE
jgi:hypothetical protein